MKKYRWVIGIDEVGRGPLAGPVVVCACAMREHEYKKVRFVGLTDSKKLSAKARAMWFDRAQVLVKEKKLTYALAQQSARAIDRCGISVCIRRCIDKALRNLALDPKYCTVLLDGGLRAPTIYHNQQTIVRGDSKKKIISLASVIAKVSRDRLMSTLHKKYPKYAWDANKGYGTAVHRKAIGQYGVTKEHRITFLRRILDKDLK